MLIVIAEIIYLPGICDGNGNCPISCPATQLPCGKRPGGFCPALITVGASVIATSDIIALDVDVDKLFLVTKVPSVLNEDLTNCCPWPDGEIVGGVSSAPVIGN